MLEITSTSRSETVNEEHGLDLGLRTAALAGMAVSPRAVAIGLVSVFDGGDKSFTGWTTCTARGTEVA